jgi:hypothetical protein
VGGSPEEAAREQTMKAEVGAEGTAPKEGSQ